MTQTVTLDNNNGYFSSSHSKPQPRTTQNRSGLFNRRQQQHPQAAVTYLPQLELPSLPPLSQLLTTDKVKKENANPTTTTDAAAVAAAMAEVQVVMMPQQNMNYTTATAPATQPIFYNATNTTGPADFNVLNNGTANMAQLMAAGGDPTFVDTTAMYNAPSDPAVTAAMLSTYPPPPPHQIDLSQQHYNNQQHNNRQRQLSNSSASSAEKIYSFVAIPGTNQKKRPRRRYDEIERLYHCNYAGCTKAYGTLNHLNAHVSMQKHGAKRYPAEFKEMRKEWRIQKKEREQHKKALNEQHNNMMHNQQSSNIHSQQPQSFNQQQFPTFGRATTQQFPPSTTNTAMSLNGFY